MTVGKGRVADWIRQARRALRRVFKYTTPRLFIIKIQSSLHPYNLLKIFYCILFLGNAQGGSPTGPNLHVRG